MSVFFLGIMLIAIADNALWNCGEGLVDWPIVHHFISISVIYA